MSHATFSLPHVFPSSSRPRHMNTPSAQPFQGFHISPPNVPQSTHLLASATAPGVQRTLPYLLAARGSSSLSYNSRKFNPAGYSSESSSSSFSPRSRGSSTRMVAPAAGTQLQAGQVAGAAAAGVMHRKSRATCTLSLAHVSASAFRPSFSTSMSTSSGVESPSAASTADLYSDSGSDEESSVVHEDKLDQAQAQALKDAVGDAPVHMWVGVESPFPRVEVEVEAGNGTVSSEESMVFSEPEDVETTLKTVPIAIPSRLPIRTKKSQRSMAEKRKQSEVNIIPFPSSEASSSSSFNGYMQERHSHTRERSGSISSSYSSTSSRSYSSSSSGSSSVTSVTSSSSPPPHALLRTSPPLSLKPLPKRARRASNASIESFQHPAPAALSIDTSAATTASSSSASAVVDDRDPPSPSSPISASSSCTLIDSDDASDSISTPLSPVKTDLKAKSTLALTMENTPPPPPYSLLPPPYSPSLGKGSDAKEATTTVQSPRPRRPLPDPPAQAPASVLATVHVPEEVTPIPVEVSVIHAPVPRAAFVRIEGANEVPSLEGSGDKGLSASQPGDSVVSLPPISPPAQPPRVRTTSRTTVSGSSASTKASTPASRRSRISTGELKVLLCLYRTVVFGLESRYRLEGERSESPSSFMDQKASSPRFPLVEEDEDSDKNTHTPHSSPSTSPSAPSHFPAARFNPSSCACPSPSPCPGSSPSPSIQAFKEARQQAKAKQAADNAMDVQDALLAIRLRGLLRAQGVPEADLDLRVDSRTQLGENKDPRSTIVVEDDGGAEDLDPFAEIELDSAADSSDVGRSSVPARPFKASPPPLSRSTSSSGGKTVIAPSAAYMIALLTMRYRYASPSRRHRLPYGPRKNGAHAGGRKSKLNIAAWAADSDGGIEEQEEADFDSCSVVDWYM
ncbi:hypothetical protein D9619_012054 [Psilocybe cf. subviscida]|uniref:Uncharacterized protein n=1 Tax=Psilocybe cf. subviscida TaxID=2480587 RepID=A0A8H5B7D4_9AGAR|nr:hypothetical protein D9619_012054 [Psilocybe cf. subviscida]